MQAAEDFLETILEAHIVVTTEAFKKSDSTALSSAQEIFTKFVQLAPNNSTRNDEIFTYACETITLGLIWKSYHDSVKEGHGNSILNIWKFLLVIFKQNGRRNYSKEAAILLINLNFLTTERLAKQIVTSRFINSKGRIGCNIPCNLHLEHLNKWLKSIISHCGSNIHPQSLICASKAIGIVDEIRHRVNDTLASKSHSDSHNKPKTKKDFNRVCEVLCIMTVFNEMSSSSRKHSTITVKRGLLESSNPEVIKDWIKHNILPLLT